MNLDFDRIETDGEGEMESKSSDPNSWEMFWLKQCFLGVWIMLGVTVLLMNLPNGPHLSFDRALVRGVVAAIGSIAIVFVYRAISGRNGGEMVWMIVGTGPMMTSKADLPPMGLIAYGPVYLILMGFAALVATIERAWKRRKRKGERPFPSMADADIDARPLSHP